MINKDKLKTIANYARDVGKSVQWIYELGKRDVLKIELIDGVHFVNTDICNK